MDATRYKPPGTPLHEVGIAAVDAGTQGVLTRIRIAFAGVILYELYNVGWMLIDPNQQRFIALMLVSPVVTLALSFGMNLKSRICALLLLAFALLPRVMIYLISGKIVWTGAWLVLIDTCVLGVWATFEYHRLSRRAEAAR